MQLFVQGIGKTLTIQISPQDFVGDLALRIQDKTGVPDHIQCLCFHGKVLNSSASLADYGINQDSTIFCSIRPPSFGFQCSEHGLDSSRFGINFTPQQLHSAIRDDHFYCAKYLINKNVSLDDLLEDCTALMVALVKNSMDLAELIINKCNLSIVSAKQGTALHLACRINNSFAVKLILQKNHNSIGFKDKLSNTPLHVACKYGSTACVEELLLTGAKVDHENSVGDTPLHLAMKKGQVLCSYMLLKYGADVNYLNSSGETPLDIYETSIDADESSNESDIGNDFKFLLNNSSFSDVIFNVKGRQIFAHKCVLAARSEYFRGMFLGAMQESQCPEIRVTDIDYEIFWSMIEFLYTNQLNILADSVAIQLLLVADQYCITPMKALCVKKFQGHLTVENIAKNFSIVLAIPLVECRFPAILQCCAQFVISHWEQMVRSSRFQELTAEMMRVVSSLHSMNL